MATFYKIGSIRLCAQAALILLVSSVLAIISMLLKPSAIPVILLMYLPVLVSVYAVNCQVVGDCEVFAWVLSVMYVLMLISAMVAHQNIEQVGADTFGLVSKIIDDTINSGEKLGKVTTSNLRKLSKTVSKIAGMN